MGYLRHLSKAETELLASMRPGHGERRASQVCTMVPGGVVAVTVCRAAVAAVFIPVGAKIHEAANANRCFQLQFWYRGALIGWHSKGVLAEVIGVKVMAEDLKLFAKTVALTAIFAAMGALILDVVGAGMTWPLLPAYVGLVLIPPALQLVYRRLRGPSG